MSLRSGSFLLFSVIGNVISFCVITVACFQRSEYCGTNYYMRCYGPCELDTSADHVRKS